MRSDKEVHIMMEEHVVLSERPEDQLKAVEWARKQKKKILEKKSFVKDNALDQMRVWGKRTFRTDRI